MKPFEQRGEAIIRRLPKGAVVAEVGVLTGVLSEYLLRRRPDIRLHMVDNWLTADRQPETYKATGDEHALHTDPARVASHRAQAERLPPRFPGRAVILPLSSDVAARTFPDHSLDLVFLDADHSYQGVMLDLVSWLAKVRPGGWIGGHDFQNPDPRFRFGVDRAVREWAGVMGLAVATDLNFTWFARV